MGTGELEQSKIEITASDLEMTTFEGFLGRFFKHLKKSKTSEEAYLKTEKEYSLIFRKAKYSSYDSFRVVKNRKARTRNSKKSNI